MRVLILGIGDAFTRRYFGSAALIEHEGDYVLLDCPDLIHRELFEASREAGWSVDASRIHHILLTHLHGDHSESRPRLEDFGTLGWSGDTAFDEDHVRWLARADVVVHATNRGPVHTPLEALNSLPDAVPQKLRLVHIPDDFDPAATHLRVLRQGEVLAAEPRPRRTDLNREDTSP